MTTYYAVCLSTDGVSLICIRLPSICVQLVLYMHVHLLNAANIYVILIYAEFLSHVLRIQVMLSV